jgi:nickel superoxide dismutase
MIVKPNITGVAVVLFSAVLMWASHAGAHCEIPCGIYDDQMRANSIAEDITTIEKAMTQIRELSAKMGGRDPLNYNQLVRWVVNKEEHANRIQHTVQHYFMTQRIKPDAEKYEEKVVVLHKMLLAAMKCKQTVDDNHVDELRELLKSFEKLYFGHTHE